MQHSQRKGFTLIEVLLVIAIIAILAGIVLVAVNPTRQLQSSNNAQRESDVNAILNAIGQYALDNSGAVPSTITATPTVIGSGVGQIDICTDLVPTYIAALAFDPVSAGGGYTDCTSYNTGYTVAVDANNRVTVAAPDAEQSATISVTR